MAQSSKNKRRSSTSLEETSDGVSPKRRASSVPVTEDKENAQHQENEEDVDDEEEVQVEEEEEEVADAEAEADTSLGIRTINPEGRPAEAGIIKEIYVENFMCHKRLQVKLCRNVNFVSGQNGSGKSAILAAIQICLGAGARRTNRARNLKELVRKEASAGNAPAQAKIRVTLLNEGEDGYKHEEYGDSITVERTISLGSGYNGYKLLNHAGKEVSRNKKDLDDMLDLLNIQVENPVAVLDQEEAKKFLTGKAEDKYNFFMKATELERVDRTYATTMDQVHDLHNNKEKIKDSLNQSMRQVDTLKKKWEQHQALETLQNKLAEFKVKCAWSCHDAAADLFAASEEDMEKFQTKANKKQVELSQAEESANDPAEDETAKRDHMNELVTEAREQTDLKRNLEAELKKAILPYKTLERQLNNLGRQQQSANAELAASKMRLQELRDTIMANSGSAESEEARRTELLRETEIELEQARTEVNELRQATSVALRSYEELEPHVAEARSKVQSAERQVQAVQNTIRELESSSNDSLAILGPRVSQVHKMVQQETQKRRFKGPVVGPIGSFIKIAPGKEDFAPIAEFAIGTGTLDRFIVTNDHDRKMLQDIRKKAGCRQDCGIFQMHQGARFNVPEPPVDGIETVASVLIVSNDLVFNCLVDNAKIETRALARDKKMSEQLLLTRDGNGRQAIRGKINEVFCMPLGDKWIVRGGSLSAISNERKLRNTIGADRTAALAQSKREVEQLHQDLKQLRQEDGRVEQKHTDFQRQWNKAKKAMSQNGTRISELESNVDEIKSEMGSSTHVTVDTSESEEEVSQCEMTIETLKQSEQNLRQQVDQFKPEIDGIKSRLDESAVRSSKIMNDLTNAERDLTQFMDTQSQREELLEKKRRKLESYKEVITKHQEKLDAIAVDKEQALHTARALHFRLSQRVKYKKQEAEGVEVELRVDIDAEPTPEQLNDIDPKRMKYEAAHFEAKIDKQVRKIKEERKRRKVSDEDADVAYEKYMRAKNDVEGKTQRIEEIENKCEELQGDMKERKSRWRQLRSHLDKKTNDKFDQMLRLNKYSGSLEFQHKSNTLDLIVHKDNTKQTETKDVKALSGGERSYTTMCLLLALGESLQTPFRILDEFDVFLDPLVRKLVIKSLIHVAKKMKHRQFIFITPQDLSSLKPDPELKIFKLLPPERNANVGGPSQQVLPFASQASD